MNEILSRGNHMKGKDFEKTMRQSWAMIRSVWKRRLTDGRGRGDQPADELVLYEDKALLCEYKSTISDKFSLKEVRPNQLTALREFNNPKYNRYSYVFIETNRSCYVVNITDLTKWVYENMKMTISESELNEIGCKCQRFSDIYNLQPFIDKL